MVTLEMVEKLREKSNVSYDEAKTALEASNGDLLDAIVLLERKGKVAPPASGGRYSTADGNYGEAQAGDNSHQDHGSRSNKNYRNSHRHHHRFHGMSEEEADEAYQEWKQHHYDKKRKCKHQLKRFWNFCGNLLEKGNGNYFDTIKDGQVIMTLPVTALALLLIFAFWIVLPLLIIGLFCGYHYKFRGKDLGRDMINLVMEQASQTADNIKSEISLEKDKDE